MSDINRCIHCEKEAQFIDSEHDLYCSKKCYLAVWDIANKKAKEKQIFECKNCNQTIESCDNCRLQISEINKLVCDLDNSRHFCSKNCLFTYYNWRKIGGD